ncbi:hypothetical protein DL98DRAFT_430791 [Cadophora sp. DSE1049]|nr:hypothetical protein DL98DRAFT_430791 [Cadophora sp. DSE1049]
MIMKMHRQQSDYSRILKTMSGKVKTIEIQYYVLLYTEECRIIEGRLMHRLQRVYVLRKRSDFNRHPPSEMICPHLLIRLSLQDIETEASRMMRCLQCRTEYRTAFKRLESHGLALVVSRWKDLGPKPENKIWAQHIPPKALSSLRGAFVGGESALGECQIQEETWTQEGYPSSLFGDEDGDDSIFQFLSTRENRAKLSRLQQRN